MNIVQQLQYETERQLEQIQYIVDTIQDNYLTKNDNDTKRLALCVLEQNLRIDSLVWARDNFFKTNRLDNDANLVRKHFWKGALRNATNETFDQYVLDYIEANISI